MPPIARAATSWLPRRKPRPTPRRPDPSCYARKSASLFRINLREETIMAYSTLLVGKADGIATITLNRPERLNALSAELLTQLPAALDDADAGAGMRTLLLTGAGPGFRSGAGTPSRDINPGAGPATPGPAPDR